MDAFPPPPRPLDPRRRRAQRLIEALIATGEEERGAFARSITLHLRSFWHRLRICGDRQAAEDVLSEVDLTIWKRAGDFERAAPVTINWLATIAATRHRLAAPLSDARRRRGSTTFPKSRTIACRPRTQCWSTSARGQLHHCLDELDSASAMPSAPLFDGLTIRAAARDRCRWGR